MRFKKYYFLIFFFIFTSILYFHIDKKNKKGTNLKFLSRNKFLNNLQNPPAWVDEQISNDFQDAGHISDESLQFTMQCIKANDSFRKEAFYRYRIINNKFYKYCFKNEKNKDSEIDFERAVQTLLRLIKVNDVDFIYSDLDGLPLDLVPKSFYHNTQNAASILCHAKLKNEKKLILIPDHGSFCKSYKNLIDKILKENKKNLWDQKQKKAFWRGGSNDQEYTLKNYRKKPRFVISKLSNEFSDFIDAGLTQSWGFQLKDVLEKEIVIKNFATTSQHLKYKYLPIIDGNMCTYSGYQWRLLSNSVCLKQDSDQIQWFYIALKPYEHYIPVKNDISDLIDKINWARNNDNICYQIANRATIFAKNNLMLENAYVYLYKVLQKYSKHQNLNKKKVLKEMKADNRWICMENRRRRNKK